MPSDLLKRIREATSKAESIDKKKAEKGIYKARKWLESGLYKKWEKKGLQDTVSISHSDIPRKVTSCSVFVVLNSDGFDVEYGFREIFVGLPNE